MIWRTLAPYALTAALAAGVAYWVQGMRWDADVTAIRLAHTDVLLTAERIASKQAAALSRELDTLEKEARERETDYLAGAAERDAVNRGLQQQVADLSRRPARTPAPDGQCPASETERVMFAEVFPGANDFAGRVAQEADRLRDALTSCHAQYEAVRASTRCTAD